MGFVLVLFHNSNPKSNTNLDSNCDSDGDSECDRDCVLLIWLSRKAMVGRCCSCTILKRRVTRGAPCAYIASCSGCLQEMSDPASQEHRTWHAAGYPNAPVWCPAWAPAPAGALGASQHLHHYGARAVWAWCKRWIYLGTLPVIVATNHQKASKKEQKLPRSLWVLLAPKTVGILATKIFWGVPKSTD